jgi:hypothetical protein
MSGSQNTLNTTAFIEAQQYSAFILSQLHDGLLPEQFYRNVSDFGSGTTLNIKTIGTATIQEVTEETPIIYNPIDTSTVTLSITDYVGDGWSFSDVLRQDGSQVEILQAMRAQEATRAIQENFETRFLTVADLAHTADSNNSVNGFAHRFVASGTNDILTQADLVAMKLSFDKANVPQMGRIAIVDPVVEATLNKLVQFTSTRSLDYAPQFQAILETGFARQHKFLFNLFGFDFWTSNRLPSPADTALPDSAGANATDVSSGYVSNIFMCVADDNCRPVMAAWRQMPSVEGERNKDLARDEFVTRARWGLGAQRVDTLGVIATSATATA